MTLITLLQTKHTIQESFPKQLPINWQNRIGTLKVSVTLINTLYGCRWRSSTRKKISQL